LRFKNNIYSFRFSINKIICDKAAKVANTLLPAVTAMATAAAPTESQ
jgi:hypothetical protein